MQRLERSGIKTIIFPFRWILIHALIFFFSAGHLAVIRAWMYYGLIIIFTIINTVIMIKKNPGLLNRRGKIENNIKKYDLLILICYLILMIIILPLIAGFDIGRFKRSQLNYLYLILGLGLFLPSWFLIQWAMLINNHFEGLVRIQENIGHDVISAGPYRVIRHPGYLGMIFGSVVPGLIIGSQFALVVSAFAIVFLIIRTYYEDKTLRRELPGYMDYAKKVKYRLFPGLW